MTEEELQQKGESLRNVLIRIQRHKKMASKAHIRFRKLSRAFATDAADLHKIRHDITGESVETYRAIVRASGFTEEELRDQLK